jgi:hypothetical protein
MPIKTKGFQLPGFTLRQLRNMTPRPTWERATKCRVAGINYGIGSRIGFQRHRPKYPTWYNELRAYVVCPSRKKRYAYIRFYGPPTEQTPVWVWCSCEHFAYTYEWILAQQNSSSIATGYESQGVAITNQPPTVRNKQRRPGLCKHLLQAAKIALAQTKDLAAEKGEEAQQKGASVANLQSPQSSRIKVIS